MTKGFGAIAHGSLKPLPSREHRENRLTHNNRENNQSHRVGNNVFLNEFVDS
jgi:hypothetical protein